jgi:hypothetical protein
LISSQSKRWTSPRKGKKRIAAITVIRNLIFRSEVVEIILSIVCKNI